MATNASIPADTRITIVLTQQQLELVTGTNLALMAAFLTPQATIAYKANFPDNYDGLCKEILAAQTALSDAIIEGYNFAGFPVPPIVSGEA